MPLRVLIAGLNKFPNQFSRLADRFGVEPVMINDKNKSRMSFDPNCDALIICPSQISHNTFQRVSNHYRTAKRPVFVSTCGAALIDQAFGNWANANATPVPVPESLPLPENDDDKEENMSNALQALTDRITNLTDRFSHLEDVVVAGLAKIEASDVGQVKELSARAFKTEEHQTEVMAVFLSIPEKKRKKALAMMEMFADD